MTFDAFAKGLLDRFGQVLPDRWRPSSDYQIVFPNKHTYADFLKQTCKEPPRSVGNHDDISALCVKQFERHYIFGSTLPAARLLEPSPGEWAADRYWRYSLHGRKSSYLSFPMIGRLVELLLRLNPMARDALRLTYSHLFLDEFQDTTQIQYDLVRTIFRGTKTVVTAVGDNKQQIMRWAMAMDDSFAAFDTDFNPKRTPLHNNYRSSPELVRIQHILAQELDTESVEPNSMTMNTVAEESCAIWEFQSPEREAEKLAEFVVAEMRKHDLRPRDFVLLVRQRTIAYAKVLQPAFTSVGITLRNETGVAGSIALQDLLVEEVSELTICVLRMAMMERAGRHWTECQELVSSVRGIGLDEEVSHSQLAKELDIFASSLRREYPSPPKTNQSSLELVEEVLAFVGQKQIVSAHPAYRQGNWLEKVLESIAVHLAQSATASGRWVETLDYYEGIDAIPLMTIHKSKGLEYHTVVFVGLDDDAWWSFKKDKVEGMAGFFVGFTRAEQQVVFTYCASRGNRVKIAPLYQLLELAGVRYLKVV